MRPNLWPTDAESSVLTKAERARRLINFLMTAARRMRESDTEPALTELVRAAFMEERSAFLQLVKQVILEERERRGRQDAGG